MYLPPEYFGALSRLADVFSAYEQARGGIAVLVDGAAAAIHTDGAFMSADFDVAVGNDAAFEAAMGTVDGTILLILTLQSNRCRAVISIVVPTRRAAQRVSERHSAARMLVPGLLASSRCVQTTDRSGARTGLGGPTCI
jgi:hypothetical protein